MLRMCNLLFVLVLVLGTMVPQGHAYTGNALLWTQSVEYPKYFYLCKGGLCCWEEGKGILKVSAVGGSHLTVSNTGLIAFVRIVEDDYDGRGNPKTGLFILDAGGQVERTTRTASTIRDVHWSPDGSTVAFVTGVADENSFDSYEKPETSIYDVQGDKTAKIFDGGARLYWAAFDGKLYIYDKCAQPVVNRWNPTTGEVEPTDLKDIQFSPDGRYYYVMPRDPREGLRLYVSKTNEEVVELEDATVSPSALSRLEPRQWFDNDRIICMIQTGSSDFYGLPMYIINVRSGEIRKSHHFVVSPYTADSVVVRLSDGSLQLENVSEMDMVQPEDLPRPAGSRR